MVMRVALLASFVFLGISVAAQQDASQGHLFPIHQAGKWGFIDRTGKVVVAPRFDQALEFSDGMGAVRVDKKWGYVDAAGELRIPPQFEDLFPVPFCGAGALVYDPSGVTFVNSSNKLVKAGKWERMQDCVNGVMAVRLNNKWGYISTDGRVMVEPTLEAAGWFGDGLGSAKQDGKWGFVDQQGRWVISPQFEEVGWFSQGLAPARQAHLWGYIDRSGKWVLKPAFAYAYAFSENRGRVLVWGDDKVSRTGFVDRSGKLAISPQYPAAGDFTDGRAMVRVGNRYGFINPDGRLVIPATYDWAAPFSGGLALVKNFGNARGESAKAVEYYVSPEGKVVWKSE
jgi:hypothetical protein